MGKKKSSRANRKSSQISKAEVTLAQAKWKAAIIEIGEAYTHGKNVVACATEHINKLYAYQVEDQTVLFKPTKCAERQFRLTFDGALSYFVGHALADKNFPEDKGFATTPFIDVRFANAGIITGRDLAIAMGNYYFTDADGGTLKVEYTFGYQRGSDGLLINTHHSSLPFAGNATS